jgi:hypothetical protein
MALLLSGAIAADAFSLRGLRDYFSQPTRAARSLQQTRATGWPAVELSSSAVFVSMYEVRAARPGRSAAQPPRACATSGAGNLNARPSRRARPQVTPQSGNGKENYLWCWDQIDKAKATNSKAIQIVPTSEPPAAAAGAQPLVAPHSLPTPDASHSRCKSMPARTPAGPLLLTPPPPRAVHWKGTDTRVDSYCYRDNYQKCADVTEAMIAKFEQGMQSCIQHAVDQGFTTVSMLPHLDNDVTYYWRNKARCSGSLLVQGAWKRLHGSAMQRPARLQASPVSGSPAHRGSDWSYSPCLQAWFKPLDKFQGVTYYDILIAPVAQAMNTVAKNAPGVKMYLTLEGGHWAGLLGWQGPLGRWAAVWGCLCCVCVLLWR